MTYITRTFLSYTIKSSLFRKASPTCHEYNWPIAYFQPVTGKDYKHVLLISSNLQNNPVVMLATRTTRKSTVFHVAEPWCLTGQMDSVHFSLMVSSTRSESIRTQPSVALKKQRGNSWWENISNDKYQTK